MQQCNDTKKIYNPWHYVPALERKPGALRNGAPFKDLMNLLPPVFATILRTTQKIFSQCI